MDGEGEMVLFHAMAILPKIVNSLLTSPAKSILFFFFHVERFAIGFSGVKETAYEGDGIRR